MANSGITAGNSQIVDERQFPTPQFRQFLVQLLRSIPAQMTGWAMPTGTGSKASFDANWTTTVSNPPTQAEVTAIRDQLIAVQKALAQFILDSKQSGLIQ